MYSQQITNTHILTITIVYKMMFVQLLVRCIMGQIHDSTLHCRLKLFLVSESDPDGSKREGGWNINENGVKEKYWADVVVQMQKAQAHVSGSRRGGNKTESRGCKGAARQCEVPGS